MNPDGKGGGEGLGRVEGGENVGMRPQVLIPVIQKAVEFMVCKTQRSRIRRRGESNLGGSSL